MRMFTAGWLAFVALGLTWSTAAAAETKKDEKKAPAYAVDTSHSSTALKTGEQGTLSFHIVPIEGKKVHPDAPLEITLSDSPALKPGKRKLGRKDVVEKKAYDPEVTTTVAAVEKGDHTVEAKLSFFLCDKDAGICERVEDKVVVTIAVDAPAK